MRRRELEHRFIQLVEQQSNLCPWDVVEVEGEIGCLFGRIEYYCLVGFLNRMEFVDEVKFVFRDGFDEARSNIDGRWLGSRPVSSSRAPHGQMLRKCWVFVGRRLVFGRVRLRRELQSRV
jgi:hypothetical protein